MGTDTDVKKDEQQETPEEEYDRLFEEEEVEQDKAEKQGDEKGISDEDSPQKTPEPTPEPEPEPTVAELKAENERLAQQLANETKRRADNQTYAQEKAAEVKRLNAVIAEHDKGNATDAELSDALAKAKKAVETDYPDMGDVLNPLMDYTAQLEAKVNGMIAETAAEKKSRLEAQAIAQKQAESQNYYRENVLPVVKEKHPDFLEVIATEEFDTWIKLQSESTQHMYAQSTDPRDGIDLMNKFKTYQGSDEAKKALEEQQKINATKKAGLDSMRAGGGAPAFKGADKDKKDESYDALWEKEPDPS
jgi:hypothetical protein